MCHYSRSKNKPCIEKKAGVYLCCFVLIFITPIHIRSCKAIDYYRNVGWTSLCSIGIMKQQVEVQLVKEALSNGSTSARVLPE